MVVAYILGSVHIQIVYSEMNKIVCVRVCVCIFQSSCPEAISLNG